jgi:hypothetical protein
MRRSTEVVRLAHNQEVVRSKLTDARVFKFSPVAQLVERRAYTISQKKVYR